MITRNPPLSGQFTTWLGDVTRAPSPDSLVEVVTVGGHRMVLMADMVDWSVRELSSDIATYRVVGKLAPKLPTPKAPAPTAPTILADAKATMESRAAQYDKPGGERSMGQTVIAFNAVTGRDLKESEGWLLLQILKDVRDRTTEAPHADSLVDGVAYASLKAEARLAWR